MELCDKFLHDCIKLNPSMNDVYRFKEYEHLRHVMTDSFSDKERDKFIKLLRTYKKRVLSKDIKKRTKYDEILLDDIKIYLDEESYDNDYIPFDALNNFPLSMLTEINGDGFYQFTDLASYVDFMNRLQTIPHMCESMIKMCRKGIKKKIVLSKRVAFELLSQYQAFLKTPLEVSVTLKIPKQIKELFLYHVQIYLVRPLEKLVIFLQNDYICKCDDSISLRDIKHGHKLYKGLLKENTLDEFTPERLHKLGLVEVKRILGLLKVFQKYYKKNSLEELFSLVDVKDKDPFKSIQKILKDLNEEMLPALFGESLTKEDMPLVKKVPKESNIHFAYYMHPSYDGKKKGSFYINTTSNQVRKYELLTLCIHECLPGHHYQLLKHLRDESIPLYVRSQNNTGYTEGWATYCENYVNPKSKKDYIFKLRYELHRALRLVVDTGIHHYKWSFQKCYDYMKQYLHYTQSHIENELIRYICDPGQGLAYKVGELTFLKLRDIYLEKYPGKIIDYHKLIMDIGPCSLDMLIKEFLSRY
jgi:uncharacterized protein (DUF885 family)